MGGKFCSRLGRLLILLDISILDFGNMNALPYKINKGRYWILSGGWITVTPSHVVYIFRFVRRNRVELFPWKAN